MFDNNYQVAQNSSSGVFVDGRCIILNTSPSIAHDSNIQSYIKPHEDHSSLQVHVAFATTKQF